MNVYLVTWFDDDCDDEYRTEQVDAYDPAAACYGVGVDVKQVISVTRIYKGND